MYYCYCSGSLAGRGNYMVVKAWVQETDLIYYLCHHYAVVASSVKWGSRQWIPQRITEDINQLTCLHG